MSDGSAIEWTDASWNVLRGCSRVSAGCVHCYAEREANRHAGPRGAYEGLVRVHQKADGRREPRWTGEVRFVADKLAEPLAWRKPRRVFVNSMSDLFHEGVSNEQLSAIFGVMAACPQHAFQVLTKRPERMLEFFGARFGLENAEETIAWEATRHGVIWDARGPHAHLYPRLPSDLARRRPWVWPLTNVDIGVSVEDQATADERIPFLLRARKHVGGALWVSYEPAIGPVDFRLPPRRVVTMTSVAPDYSERTGIKAGDRIEMCTALDWIVIGGESGPGARPFDLAWARSTIAQCREAGVPVFVKQLGARPVEEDGIYPNREHFAVRLRHRKGADMDEWPEDLRVREYPRCA